MSVQFISLSTDAVRAVRAGGLDANGQVPERRISDGNGVPCRHCMKMVAKGRPYLVLGWRPFTAVQPYAETGPIFLCADDCASGTVRDTLPEFLQSETYIVRGYGSDERIVYGTGRVTPRDEIVDRCGQLLGQPGIAFVHVRSASNNCYHVRAEAVAAD